MHLSRAWVCVRHGYDVAVPGPDILVSLPDDVHGAGGGGECRARDTERPARRTPEIRGRPISCGYPGRPARRLFLPESLPVRYCTNCADRCRSKISNDPRAFGGLPCPGIMTQVTGKVLTERPLADEDEAGTQETDSAGMTMPGLRRRVSIPDREMTAPRQT